MQMGLEQEFFLVNGDDQIITIPTGSGLPHDECGWLLEARGKPFGNITEAVFSLKADVHRLDRSIMKTNASTNQLHRMVAEPFRTIPRTVRTAASRNYAKGLTHYQNLYGYPHHNLPEGVFAAGIHITFSQIRTVATKHGDVEYCENFDWPRLFRMLDAEFTTEIANARRLPGFYEIKSTGMVEYRSLPNNLDLEAIPDRVTEVFRRWGRKEPENYLPPVIPKEVFERAVATEGGSGCPNCGFDAESGQFAGTQ